MTGTIWPRTWRLWPARARDRTAARSISTDSPAGACPPKSSIREVRINQNPFSAQYDRIGMGRVEVFTKPGTRRFSWRDPNPRRQRHFQRAQSLHAREAHMAAARAGGRDRRAASGKKTSFFADFEVRKFTENSFVNARTLDSNLQVVAVSQGVLTPRRDTEENVKLDRQLSKDHTLTLRYTFARQAIDNQGASGFSLPSRIYNFRDAEDTVQFAETGVYGVHTVNETAGAYSRQRSRQEGNATLPTTAVLDAFTGGGSPLTLSFTNQDRIEVQNMTTVTHGVHLLRWGGRLRGVHLKDQDTQNYTGTFTFSSLDSYRITLMGQQAGWSPQQIRAAGGGASQFSIAAGNPLASLSQFDVGVFAARRLARAAELTLSLGLRYEVADQDRRPSRFRAARRRRVGSRAQRQGRQDGDLRAGAGLFYDRVSESLSLDALRRDGIHQQQFVSEVARFLPRVPSLADLLNSACSAGHPRAGRPHAGSVHGAVGRRRGTAAAEEFGGRGELSALARLAQPALANVPAPRRLRPPEQPRSTFTSRAASSSRTSWSTSLNARVNPKLSFIGLVHLGQGEQRHRWRRHLSGRLL